jgi:hypothetical protein
MASEQRSDLHHLRAQPRLKLFEPTEMENGPASTRAHLLNLSTGGALVHSVAPPARGQDIRLALGGAPRQARVMWVEERRFGVSFRVPLSPGQLNDIVDTGRARVAEASRRLGTVGG